MAINQLSLLRTKRFLPLFLTQFFGAFNDNVYKNALVIMITYSLASATHFNSQILITIAAGIFILPFFLFSALAGQIADKFDKAKLIRYTKLAEITLMLLAGIGFYFQSVFFLITLLFLIGTQATFFGPMKYSILPDQLPENELIAGNALLEAGTYFAILTGTLLGGVLAVLHAAPALVTVTVLILAIAGYVTSLSIPSTRSSEPHLEIKYDLIGETKKIIRETMQKRELSFAILGISWFWLIGATYLSQFPTYTKVVLGASSSVVTLFLTFFTLGIGLGSLMCNRLLKGRIHATYVPLAALAMTVFAIDLVLASGHVVSKSGHLQTMGEFLSHLQNWHVLFDLLFLSM